ncbi:MAG TPA: hypothetical protein VI357_25195 [Mycobacteriales bacterium]
MKRWLAALAAATALGMTAWVAPAAAADRAYCGIGWGSLPKEAAWAGSAHLTGVRAGRHACFDRLVLDLDGRQSGYSVRYVTQIKRDGSGFVVPVRGGAKLEIVSRADEDLSHGSMPVPTYRAANRAELVDVAGWRTFRQVAHAGTFEGHTTIGLGVRARLPYRVFTVNGPGAGSRLVIDVAHRW